MFFVLLRPIFCEKWKIAPPHTKRAPPQTFELAKLGEKSPWSLAKTFFFWRSPNFGRKKRLNVGFRPKKHSEFWRRPFFWRPPNFGRKKRLNFGFRPKKHSEFWRRPFIFFFFFFFFFFGDHLILGGKNVWILDFGRKNTLNFGKDLFFFFLEIT